MIVPAENIQFNTYMINLYNSKYDLSSTEHEQIIGKLSANDLKRLRSGYDTTELTDEEDQIGSDEVEYNEEDIEKDKLYCEMWHEDIHNPGYYYFYGQYILLTLDPNLTILMGKHERNMVKQISYLVHLYYKDLLYTLRRGERERLNSVKKINILSYGLKKCITNRIPLSSYDKRPYDTEYAAVFTVQLIMDHIIEMDVIVNKVLSEVTVTKIELPEQ